MPPSPKSYIVGIKVKSGNASDVYVNLRNARTKEILRKKTASNETKYNLGNEKEFPSGFANGDFLEVNVTGLRSGGTTHTVDTSRPGTVLTITLANMSTTESPKISI